MADVTVPIQGDAAQAQGAPGGMGPFSVPQWQLTNDAVDKMMMYEFYENRDRWARANVMADKQDEEAAKMFKYDIKSWTMKQDVDDAMGNIQAAYKQFLVDPTAVTLVMNPDGTFKNAEAYMALHTANDKAVLSVANANKREEGLQTLKTQRSLIDDPDDLDGYDAYYGQVLQSKPGTPVTLYANVRPRDLTTVVGKPVDVQYQEYIKNVKVDEKWTGVFNIESNATEWDTKTKNSPSWEKAVDLGNLKRINEQLAIARKGADPTKFDAMIAQLKTIGASDVADFFTTANSYMKMQNSISAGATDPNGVDQSGLGTAYEFTDLSQDITRHDFFKGLLAQTAKTGYTKELAVSDVWKAGEEIDIARQELAIRKTNAQANLLAAQNEGKKVDNNLQALAQSIKDTWYQYLNIDQTGQAGTKIADMVGPNGQRVLKPAGVTLNDDDIAYRVPVDQNLENALWLGRKTQRVAGSTGMAATDAEILEMTSKQTSVGYPLREVYMVTDKDGSNRRLVARYSDPDNKNTAFSQGWSMESLVPRMPMIYENGTSQGSKLRQQGDIAIHTFSPISKPTATPGQVQVNTVLEVPTTDAQNTTGKTEWWIMGKNNKWQVTNTQPPVKAAQ